jgi:hypothetical protein
MRKPKKSARDKQADCASETPEPARTETASRKTRRISSNKVKLMQTVKAALRQQGKKSVHASRGKPKIKGSQRNKDSKRYEAKVPFATRKRGYKRTRSYLRDGARDGAEQAVYTAISSFLQN